MSVSGDFEAAYVAAELELIALNAKLMRIWIIFTSGAMLLAGVYIASKLNWNFGEKIIVSAAVAALICGGSYLLGAQISQARNKSVVLPVLAARLGLAGTQRMADMYNRERMLMEPVKCFATIADTQDRFMVQLIKADSTHNDTGTEFEGIALRAKSTKGAHDIMIRRAGVMAKALNWFSRGPWVYDERLNARAPHARFAIYVGRDSEVSVEDYIDFSQRIAEALDVVNLGSGFAGAYRMNGWVTLLIDGSPAKWLEVGTMFDGPAKRAEHAKTALAEIDELAAGAKALWQKFNDQAS